LALATFWEIDDSQFELPCMPETLVFKMLIESPRRIRPFEARSLAPGWCRMGL
jgi:hypothetical protein